MGEAWMGSENVGSLYALEIEAWMGMQFCRQHGKWRPLHAIGRVFQRDQQTACPGCEQGGQVIEITRPDIGRKRDQGSAIVDQPETRSAREFEEIAFDQRDASGRSGHQSPGVVNGRFQPCLVEERLDRPAIELDANHGMALRGKPVHVQALAAKRNQHRLAGIGLGTES